MDIFTDISNAFNKVEWSFESHDPAWAWFIVGMYSIAALLCLRALFCSQRSLFPKSIRKKCGIFWGILFAVMLFLACNKQLDMQTYITAVAREVAHAQGWYDQRRAIQKEVIIVLGLIAFLFLSYLIYMIYNLPSSYKISMVGALFTFTFIGMRASSFHHLDHYVAQTIYGVKLHILIEICGSLIVSIGALLSVRSIGKWELYYDSHYVQSDKNGVLNKDFDLDSDEDSSFDDDFVTDIRNYDDDTEFQPEEIVVNSSSSRQKATCGVSRVKSSDDNKGSYKSAESVDIDLFTKVSSKNVILPTATVIDNASPRVDRESLMEINRKRRQLQKEKVNTLGGSVETGYRKDNKSKQHDNWISRTDETGWI